MLDLKPEDLGAANLCRPMPFVVLSPHVVSHDANDNALDGHRLLA